MYIFNVHNSPELAQFLKYINPQTADTSHAKMEQVRNVQRAEKLPACLLWQGLYM